MSTKSGCQAANKNKEGGGNEKKQSENLRPKVQENSEIN